jgi:hypothetical protein
MTPPRLEVLLDSPLSSVATFGEVVITAVHTELTEQALRVAVGAGRKVAASHPGGDVGLTLVQVGIKLPSSELRKAASEAMTSTMSHTRCVARVFFGAGFWMSTVRSVLTAIELIQPYPIPRRTFALVAPATRWLASTCGQDVSWAEGLDIAAAQVLRISADARSRAR